MEPINLVNVLDDLEDLSTFSGLANFNVLSWFVFAHFQLTLKNDFLVVVITRRYLGW